MSVETLTDSGIPVKDAFLELAHEICTREARSVEVLNREMVQWVPGASPAFPDEAIALKKVTIRNRFGEGALSIVSLEFRIGGGDEEDATSLMVAASEKPETYENPFDRGFLEDFAGIYASHCHATCLRTIREELQRKRARDNLLAGEKEKFTITDRRRLSQSA
jgi:hypothetical protein